MATIIIHSAVAAYQIVVLVKIELSIGSSFNASNALDTEE
jgi:hypothetical protein